jgi:hypothetical protein
LLAWLAFFGNAFGQSPYTLPAYKNDDAPAKYVQSLPLAPSAPARMNYTESLPPKQPAAPPVVRPRLMNDEQIAPFIRTELPGPQRLFSRESENAFFERISVEFSKQPGMNRAIFPESAVLSREPHKPREFPEMVEVIEPGYVAHRRLYFEQPNFERYGYNFGVLQPAVCLGVFYYDMAMLPYHVWTDLRDRGETNAGKCLPGDQVPFTIPRERLSVTGAVGQAGTIFGLLYLFP